MFLKSFSSPAKSFTQFLTKPPAQLTSRSVSRFFSSTPAIMVNVGDSVPSVDLHENSPGNKVNLAQELSSGKGLIIGVPAAYSPGCSDSHIPGYLASSKTKDAGKVFVVSVNDAFVMKAWGKTLDADGSSGIRFLADFGGEFTKAMDNEFDATPVLGNKRSKRYAAATEDGKITKIFVEPDNTGQSGSTAEKFL